MKRILLTLTLLTSISAFAFEQKDFSIPSDCKLNIEKAVTKNLGAEEDDTFSIVDIKLIYGGVYKNATFPIVAIVKTSDEVDPRDVLVKTSAPSNGTCFTEIVEELADGSTIEL